MNGTLAVGAEQLRTAMHNRYPAITPSRSSAEPLTWGCRVRATRAERRRATSRGACDSSALALANACDCRATVANGLNRLNRRTGERDLRGAELQSEMLACTYCIRTRAAASTSVKRRCSSARPINVAEDEGMDETGLASRLPPLHESAAGWIVHQRDHGVPGCTHLRCPCALRIAQVKW